jgi:hypothetical protein
MSFSVGRLGRVISVQDSVVIGWNEIDSCPTLAGAFIAGEIVANLNRMTTRAHWDPIAPGLWMLTVGGDNTGIMITEGEQT